LARHKGFRRRAKDARFRWQDKAFDIAESLQERSEQQGFFGVNMASTGCGKTLANGRIMYALAHPKLGARFSIALGLRTLTLQTGQAYRQHLGLGDDDLAVLVGGAAVRELFENQQQNAKKAETEHESPQAKSGSESAEALIPDNSYVSYEGSLPEGSLSEWLSKNPAAQKLLSAPVLTCTIDHLMPATESTRGGHQIAPMLRLMTSDLVLDEPDDFDLDDLPALSRLVYWAGMLGSRVLLSSATLPPALIQGLFQAYQQGRTVYQKNRGIPNSATTICCAWFDEFNSQCSEHDNSNEYLSFKQAHSDFVQKRLTKLLTADQRRVAVIQDVNIQKNEDVIGLWAKHLLKLSQELHLLNHNLDPKTGKKVSFGLIRMANIDPLIDVAQALLTMIIPTNTHIHLCVYHSRHPLVIRSHIEATLDNALNRQQEKGNAVFNVASVRQCVEKYPEQNHLFIVLASPVAEVGRDHDYDWAIVEPSSMRSIIQLAGRIRRHRFEAYDKANIYLLNSNIKSLKNNASQPCFIKPGFESGDYLLNHHELRQLLVEDDFHPLTSAPRITERNMLQPHDNLVDLEHACLKALMLAQGESHTWPVPTWWRTPVSLSGVMQQKQRFRKSQPEQLFGLIANDDGDDWSFKAYSPTVSLNPWQDNNHLIKRLPLTCAEGISFWLDDDYLTRLDDLAKELDMPLQDCAYRFGVISLPPVDEDRPQGWSYHVGLGFRRKK
jgi:CRISPR-associated endonuclease/helicase Cas3